MANDQFRDITIGTVDEFEEALAAVIEAGIKDGVDVSGAWEFQTAGSTHDWEVEIIELAKDVGEAED